MSEWPLILLFKILGRVRAGDDLVQAAIDEEALSPEQEDFDDAVQRLRAEVEALEKPLGGDPLKALEKEFSTQFGCDDPYILEVELATIATLGMPGDPLWFFVVGPPSGLKSETLRWFNGVDELVYTLSTLTSHSLITGLRGGHDLLPLLDGKALIIKDFTAILEMRRESRDQVFAQLRDCFDGYYEAFFGTVGRKSFQARFHILAAVTSAIERFYSIQSWLGQRFLLARVPEVDGFETALASAGEETEMRERFTELILRVIATLDFNAWKQIDASLVSEIRPVVDLIAKARAHVPRDGYSNIRALPEPELVPRITKQLKKLCIGRAMVFGRKTVLLEDLDFARRVALDTIPSLRRKALEAFLEGPYPVADLSGRLRLPSSTTSRLTEDLEILGLIRRRPTGERTILYELEEGVGGVLSPNNSENLDVPGNVRGHGSGERPLARMTKRNVRGHCEFCGVEGEDLLLVVLRGSNETKTACLPCAQERFDLGEPP